MTREKQTLNLKDQGSVRKCDIIVGAWLKKVESIMDKFAVLGTNISWWRTKSVLLFFVAALGSAIFLVCTSSKEVRASQSQQENNVCGQAVWLTDANGGFFLPGIVLYNEATAIRWDPPSFTPSTYYCGFR